MFKTITKSLQLSQKRMFGSHTGKLSYVAGTSDQVLQGDHVSEVLRRVGSGEFAKRESVVSMY
jgi:hypothetical protein